MQDCWSMQVSQQLLAKTCLILSRTIKNQPQWQRNYSSSLPHVITHPEHTLNSLLTETVLRNANFLIFCSFHTLFIWNMRSESYSFQPYRESLCSNLFLLELSQNQVLQVLRGHSQVRHPFFLLPSSRIQACKVCVCNEFHKSWCSLSLDSFLH